MLDPFGDWSAFVACNAKEITTRVGIDNDAEEETPLSKAVVDWDGELKPQDLPDSDISPRQRTLTALQGDNTAAPTTRQCKRRPTLRAVPDSDQRTDQWSGPDHLGAALETSENID